MAAHAASYPDPIEERAGDPLRLTGRRELWDSHLWLWAAGPDGREGWVPDGLVREGPAGPLAAGDYSARELTCHEGEAVTVLRELYGWCECRSAAGAVGWVPARSLAAGKG